MELHEKTHAPFPRGAYSIDKSRGFDLTSIKAQYVVERLNKCFGVMGWDNKLDFKETDKGVVCFLTLTVRYQDQSRTINSVGASETRKLTGDTYKSAMTDALGKAASWLGIGNDVYKGLVK